MSEGEVSKIEENIINEKEVKEIKVLDEPRELKELQERIIIIEQALKTITEILENKISETSPQKQNVEEELGEKITELEKRVYDIESYLSRRRGALRR